MSDIIIIIIMQGASKTRLKRKGLNLVPGMNNVRLQIIMCNDNNMKKNYNIV